MVLPLAKFSPCLFVGVVGRWEALAALQRELALLVRALEKALVRAREPKIPLVDDQMDRFLGHLGSQFWREDPTHQLLGIHL